MYPGFYSEPAAPYDPADPATFVPYAPRQTGGWHFFKIVWFISPRYQGPVLVRGRQVDGTNRIRFGDGAAPRRELRIPAGRGLFSHGWRAGGSNERVRAAGCYALQVDGVTFSRVIVFRAAQWPRE